MRIPFFDMAAELATVRADVDRAIARVLDSGVFIGGPEVSAFESALAKATSVTTQRVTERSLVHSALSSPGNDSRALTGRSRPTRARTPARRA